MSAGWLPAKMLQAGITLVNRDNEQTLKVVSQTKLDKTDTVYNFEVDEFHTYHIGEFGVWVHNADCSEIVLPSVKSYEQARNKAFQLIEEVAPMLDSKPLIGRLRTSQGYGQVIGREAADGKVRWRLDYDDTKGMHINVEDFRLGKGAGKAKKYAIPIEGATEVDYINYLKQLNR